MKIYLTPKSYLKLQYYTQESDDEISGLGLVLVDGSKIIIGDVYLFKQDCTSGSTDLDKKNVALFIEEFHKRGGNSSNLKLWWHSHDIMESYFSPTDEQTIKDLGEFSPFVVSIVTNKKNEFLGRVDIFKPFRLTFEDCKINIMMGEDKNLRKQIQKEIKQKVKPLFAWNGKRFKENKKEEKINKKVQKLLEGYHNGKYQRSDLSSSVGTPPSQPN